MHSGAWLREKIHKIKRKFADPVPQRY